MSVLQPLCTKQMRSPSTSPGLRGREVHSLSSCNAEHRLHHVAGADRFTAAMQYWDVRAHLPAFQRSSQAMTKQRPDATNEETDLNTSGSALNKSPVGAPVPGGSAQSTWPHTTQRLLTASRSIPSMNRCNTERGRNGQDVLLGFPGVVPPAGRAALQDKPGGSTGSRWQP